MITKAVARIPATRPCTISPSHRRRAGEAKIKATRMKRAFDTFRRMAMAAADLAPDKSLHTSACLIRRWRDQARVRILRGVQWVTGSTQVRARAGLELPILSVQRATSDCEIKRSALALCR